QHGDGPVRDFEAAYPQLKSCRYDPASIDLDPALDGADVVIVHEWNPPELIRRFGEHRRHRRHRLYFHDTHHRCVSNPESIGDLCDYDGILVFGESLKKKYEARGHSAPAHVWHEAADTHVFFPRQRQTKCGDIVWIGNWGDDERTRELREFLFLPVRTLGLRGVVHGVRYPNSALQDLACCGLRY